MTVMAVRESALVVPLDGTCELSREELGGKAWSINRMRSLGLPVPPAIAATTENCRAYYAGGMRLSQSLWQQITDSLRVLETGSGRQFGSATKPLLVSVRSGAARSMPGMMDTVLDLGINDQIEAALAAETGDAAYAADTHRRFRHAYRDVVLGDSSGEVPNDPWLQLRAAVEAVFRSWNSPRAQAYRHHHDISVEAGTAVTVQAMVFGNLDDRSGTGVLFTRNPMTGDREPFGEWLPRGQGEDVVSGRADPLPLSALRAHMPDVHAELLDLAAQLERDSRDIQDIEFTVEAGRLWLLQSRTAKRSPRAAVRAAVAMVDEGLLDPRQALSRITAKQARSLLAPTLDRERLAESDRAATGLPVCEGVATGIVVIDPDEAEQRAEAGEDVVLARVTTSPDDMHGVISARAVITEHGGSTSHAAVVSRELGRVCVVGCGAGSVTGLAGQWVTVDGGNGEVWLGAAALSQVDEADDTDFTRLIEWAQAAVPQVHRAGIEAEPGPQLPALLALLETDALRGVEKSTVPAASETQGDTSIDELTVLRLLTLKGRTEVDVLAESLAVNRRLVEESVSQLITAGWVKSLGSALRPTAEGRRYLAELITAEAARVDRAAAGAVYDRFSVLNGEFKKIITDWQMRDLTTPNDHSDPEYDRNVLASLSALFDQARPLIAELPSLTPRLAHYVHRFTRAHARIANGDHGSVAAIGKDSFHTIWFELHEDLIGIIGANRADEAAAGRAL
ncbi:pyruvate, phosphate dikinase [Nocardia sp. CA-120079]|uniref:pyruvate, phosphate dikinase n=1 Tax=Nocardia sp. CA-120079 TaxID=3239974 RepID=UPI003D99DD6F